MVRRLRTWVCVYVFPTGWLSEHGCQTAMDVLCWLHLLSGLTMGRALPNAPCAPSFLIAAGVWVALHCVTQCC